MRGRTFLATVLVSMLGFGSTFALQTFSGLSSEFMHWFSLSHARYVLGSSAAASLKLSQLVGSNSPVNANNAFTTGTGSGTPSVSASGPKPSVPSLVGCLSWSRTGLRCADMV